MSLAPAMLRRLLIVFRHSLMRSVNCVGGTTTPCYGRGACSECRCLHPPASASPRLAAACRRTVASSDIDACLADWGYTKNGTCFCNSPYRGPDCTCEQLPFNALSMPTVLPM